MNRKVFIKDFSWKMSDDVSELKNTATPSTTTLSSSFFDKLPSSFNKIKDKTIDTSQNAIYKSSKSSEVFTFGDHKGDGDKKSEAAFTFTLEKPNLDVISNNLNIEILKTNDIKEEINLEKSDELKTDKNSVENEDNTNQEADEEDLNQEKQQNEKLNSDKEFNMKMLFNEFKELIKNFINERVESEKKITALEKRVEVLENERKLLQEVKEERAGEVTSLPNNYECAAATSPNTFLQSSVNASFNRNGYHTNFLSSLASAPLQTGIYNCQTNPTINPMNIQEAQAGLLSQCRIKSHSELETLHRERVLYEPLMKNEYGNMEDKTIKIPSNLDPNQRKENIDNARFNDLQLLIQQSVQNALKGALTQFR